MAKYACSVCGWIYDEDLGMPTVGLPAGTKWEDVPDSFECPQCVVPKLFFKKVDE